MLQIRHRPTRAGAPREAQQTSGRRVGCVLAIGALLSFHAILGAWMAYRNSPAIDETAHVVFEAAYTDSDDPAELILVETSYYGTEPPREAGP